MFRPSLKMKDFFFQFFAVFSDCVIKRPERIKNFSTFESKKKAIWNTFLRKIDKKN